jgi:hypothetical protein
MFARFCTSSTGSVIKLGFERITRTLQFNLSLGWFCCALCSSYEPEMEITEQVPGDREEQ